MTNKTLSPSRRQWHRKRVLGPIFPIDHRALRDAIIFLQMSTRLSTTLLEAESVDDLVLLGVEHVQAKGAAFRARAGEGWQAYSTEFLLTDSQNRLHLLRHPDSIRYLCREFIAYFNGSLKVSDGLADASRRWLRLCRPDGTINSNYGYYVFHQQGPEGTQYDWVVSRLAENMQSRRGIVVINQLSHKVARDLDFPCAISLQFFISEGLLCCDATTRSCDVVTGLPYDIAFFSFLVELLAADVGERLAISLQPGPTRLRTSFTQLYDHNSKKLSSLLENSARASLPTIRMPPLKSAAATLNDIYSGTTKTETMAWIASNANLPDSDK